MPGHQNVLRLAHVTVAGGRELRLALACGRPHRYEGWSDEELETPVRALAAAGVTRLVLTNSVRRPATGCGRRPRRGVLRRRRPAAPAAGDAPERLRLCADDAVARVAAAARRRAAPGARRVRLRLRPAVRDAGGGRLARALRHVVGMSAAPEARAAAATGVECCLLALVANVAAAVGSHEDVLAAGGRLAGLLAAGLARAVLARWPDLLDVRLRGSDVDFVHDVIAWKRDGNELDEPRVRAFVEGVVSGAVPSYQASALLMAMVLRGLSDDETLSLARAMVDSGKMLELGVLRRPVLDKHSSGGVGDKVTLVLAPLVAACGAIFGKMSGRGLGHTGGTLDKLESIPGFRVQLPQGDFLRQLERIGVAVVSQSERIVPADRLLYALRDVTGTVECDGLIAASIMAKKVASGTSAVVLDIKVGRGAFAADLDHAREIGRLCRLIGAAYGRPTSCLFTAMDAPARAHGGQPARGGGGVAGARRRGSARRARGHAGARRRTAAAGRPRRGRGRGARAGGGGAGRRTRRRALRALVLRPGRPLAARASFTGSPGTRSRRRGRGS